MVVVAVLGATMRSFTLFLAMLVVAAAGQRDQCPTTSDPTACEACFDSETVSAEVSEQCLNCANAGASYTCVACLSYAITDWVKISSCLVGLNPLPFFSLGFIFGHGRGAIEYPISLILGLL